MIDLSGLLYKETDTFSGIFFLRSLILRKANFQKFHFKKTIKTGRHGPNLIKLLGIYLGA